MRREGSRRIKGEVKTKKGTGVGKKRGRKWSLAALQGSGAKSGHPDCLEGSPGRPAFPQ